MSWIIILLTVLLKVNGLDGATKASKHLKEYLHISATEDRPLYHERSKVTVSYKCQGEFLNIMGITFPALDLRKVMDYDVSHLGKKRLVRASLFCDWLLRTCLKMLC